MNKKYKQVSKTCIWQDSDMGKKQYTLGENI